MTFSIPAFCPAHVYYAEISYAHISGYTFDLTIRTISQTSSPSDQEFVILNTGDTLQRQLPIEFLTCDKQLNTYVGQHTFAGPGTYELTCSMSGRYPGILNMPNPEQQPICVSALLIISPLLGMSTSVHYLEPFPHCCNDMGPYYYDPVAMDANGDSLVFEQIIPSGTLCDTIPGYLFPSEYLPGPGNMETLDQSTGAYTWDSPPTPGYYALAIRSTEWRNGQMIGQTTRDMTLCVLSGVGLEEGMAGSTFTVISTVSSGIFILDLPSPGRVEVVGALGQFIRGWRSVGQNEVLDLSSQPDGLYVLTLRTDDGRSFSQRIVKAQ